MKNEKISLPEREFCPFTKLIHFLSKKWMIVIIKSISDGCKTYSEIEKKLIWSNPRILSSRLKDLQEWNFVEKKNISTNPTKYLYCLTEKGVSLSKYVDSLHTWAKKNVEK